jgi:hypothetical protein
MSKHADLENWFKSHAPRPGQPERYVAIREAGHALALAIATHAPQSADQMAAIRKVREAVMTANAAIACEPGDISAGMAIQLGLVQP